MRGSIERDHHEYIPMWEEYEPGGATKRLRVHGGHLYRHLFGSQVVMCFVPGPHEEDFLEHHAVAKTGEPISASERVLPCYHCRSTLHPDQSRSYECSCPERRAPCTLSADDLDKLSRGLRIA